MIHLFQRTFLTVRMAMALGALTLTCASSWADPLILQQFDQVVPDNSPLGVAGWNALAVSNNTVVRDFTSFNPDGSGNYPTVSRAVNGGLGGVTGNAVMGLAGTANPSLIWTNTTTSLQGRTITNISFYTKNNSSSSTERIAVQVGGQWYASTQSFNDAGGNSVWAFNSFTFTTNAAAWQVLNTNTLTLGAPLASPLPDGNVQAVGVYGAMPSGKIRVDGFSVSGLASGLPQVGAPVASPGTNVPAPDALTLSAAASGSTPISYQWRRNGLNLSDGPNRTGANASQMTVFPTTVGDSGSYDVVVTNSFGAVTSATCVVTISAGSLVLLERFNESSGDPGILAQATGWRVLARAGAQVNDYTSTPNPPQNANYPNLSLSASADGVGSGYFVMGQNDVVNPVFAWWDTSASLHNYFLERVNFYTRNNSALSSVQIAVRIGANWYVSTNAMTDSSGGGSWEQQTFSFNDAPGAWQHFNTNTLTAGSLLTNALPAGDVAAVGMLGKIGNDLTGKIRIDEFQITASSTSAPPSNLTTLVVPGTNVFAGTDVTLSVSLTGARPLHYQWRRNGVALTNGVAFSGVTNSTLLLADAAASASGAYDVVVTNAFGTNASAPVYVTVISPSAASVNLAGYDATGAISVVTPDTNTLQVLWSDKAGAQYRAHFNLLGGQVLIRSLETAPSAGAPFTVVAEALDPRYRVTLGTRFIKAGAPYVFFDRVDINSPAPVAHLSTLNPTRVRVTSESARRIKIAFSELTIGPYRGELTCYVYDGSPMIQFQASMLVEDPWVAYVYDTLVYGGFANITYKDSNGTLQTVPSASLTQTAPGNAAKLAVKHRSILGSVAGGSGTVGVMAPPHACMYPTDFSDNFGYAQAGRDFIGTRMSGNADNRYRPWVDAPLGSLQRMDVFLTISAQEPAAALTNILAYTHNDAFKTVPGHYVMAEHFHPEFTANHLSGGDSITPFKQAMQAMGVQIVQPMEFHGPGHPFDNTVDRLAELNAMFALLQAHSDDTFLLIPGEEYNHWFGGHWSYMFPRPVYFTGWNGQGGRTYRQTNVISGGVTYPTVYQVGDADRMLQLLQDEGGIAWSAHPRVKASRQMPDSYVNSNFYRDDAYLAGDWKALPFDHSKDRLGFRSFQLMDDTAQWGYKKSMLGEVDTFALNSTHEIYAHMNVNYLKLPAFPSKTNWTSVVECIRDGDFFTTTGEVLIHSWNAGSTGVTATVEWYFPPAFAEITWGDASGVHRKKKRLLDGVEFETRQIVVEADLSAANWVRFEVWDVARNGAFTQIHWLTPPSQPAVIAGAVTSFTLIDADTDTPVPGYDPIPDGAVLSVATLPTNVTFRANTSPLLVGSVTIGLDGNNVTRTQWPYSLGATTTGAGIGDSPTYNYSPNVLTIGNHVLTATPYQGATPGTPLSLSFSVVNSNAPAESFSMDGRADSASYGITPENELYAAVKGTTLYVAASATEENDQFILVTDAPSPLSPPPWNKAGQVAFNIGTEPYLTQEGGTRVVSWSNGGVTAQNPAAVAIGFMEGSIDLAQVFGTVPATVYIALARYGSGAGGSLVPGSQIPAGNFNAHIESDEFLPVPLAAVRDDDFNGILDVLESATGFRVSCSRDAGALVIRWLSLPGRTYQVFACNTLQQPFEPLSQPILAGAGVFNLSYADVPVDPISQRFYRVQLLQ
jgi:hypothetical protein